MTVTAVRETPLLGATSATLTIQNFGAADRGAYAIWVSDGIDTQVSSHVVLTVVPEPDVLAGIVAGFALLVGMRRMRVGMK